MLRVTYLGQKYDAQAIYNPNTNQLTGYQLYRFGDPPGTILIPESAAEAVEGGDPGGGGGGGGATINGLSGDVTLAAGTNITITPSGQTLTIAANNVTGGGGAIRVSGTTISNANLLPGTGIDLTVAGSNVTIAADDDALNSAIIGSGGILDQEIADGGKIDTAIQDAITDLKAETNPFTQYLLKSQNLADLPNPATARSNLGLGNAATKNTGNTSGTVAAGDDPRFAGLGGNASETPPVSPSAGDAWTQTDASGNVINTWHWNAALPDSIPSWVSDVYVWNPDFSNSDDDAIALFQPGDLAYLTPIIWIQRIVFTYHYAAGTVNNSNSFIVSAQLLSQSHVVSTTWLNSNLNTQAAQRTQINIITEANANSVVNGVNRNYVRWRVQRNGAPPRLYGAAAMIYRFVYRP